MEKFENGSFDGWLDRTVENQETTNRWKDVKTKLELQQQNVEEATEQKGNQTASMAKRLRSSKQLVKGC